MMIGDEIRALWESKIGYRIKCASCRDFLDSLNAMTQIENPDLLIANLDANLPFPASLRTRLKPADRQKFIAQVISRLLPVKRDAEAVAVRTNRRSRLRAALSDIDVTPTIIDRDRFAGRCVAVTSLSPNPDRAARQALCLQSWRDIGLKVITVDTAAKPRIKTLLDAGAETGLPFLLINADIEISGDHALIEAAIQQPEKLTIGIRYNHAPDASRGRSQKEAAGLDAFLMTPEMAATVPDLPFTIGYPVWDYWLPYHFRSLGHAFHWIDSPLFFHATHELQWSREDWVRGSAWLNDHYGINLTYGNTEFRESLSDHSKC